MLVKQIPNISIVAVIFAIISVHMLILTYLFDLRTLLFMTFIDAVLAIVLGMKKNNDLGHGAAITGLVILIITLVLFIN